MKGMPMYAMYIVDTQMQVESEYRKDGIYITDVVAQDGRIHLKRLVPLGENQYLYQNEDTIVCNQRVEKDPLEGIGWFAPRIRERFILYRQIRKYTEMRSVHLRQRHFLMNIQVFWIQEAVLPHHLITA